MVTEVDVDDRLLNIVKDRDNKSKWYKMRSVGSRYAVAAATLLAILVVIVAIPSGFLPIADVIVGAIYANDCPANSNLALSVILMGASGCLFIFLVILSLVLLIFSDGADHSWKSKVSKMMPVMQVIAFLVAMGPYSYCFHLTITSMAKCSEAVMANIAMFVVVKNTTDTLLVGNQGNTTTSQLVYNNYTIPANLSCFTTNKTFANSEIYCDAGLYNFAYHDLIAKVVLFFVAYIIFGIACCIMWVGDKKEAEKCKSDPDTESEKEQ